MYDFLTKIGVPSLWGIVVSIFVFFAQQIWSFLSISKLKASQDIQSQIVDKLNLQLEEFYLPLRERFRLSRLLFETTNSWKVDNKYVNEKLNIESNDVGALRKIAVRRLFLPYNKETEQIILDKSHLKTNNDSTNYESILQHFVIWRTLEEAMLEGEIKNYDATNLLSFPSEEVEKHFKICEELLSIRNRIFKDILNLKQVKRRMINI